MSLLLILMLSPLTSVFVKIRLATGRKVGGSNTGGDEIFHTRADGPWGPINLPSNRYQVIPGVKRPGRGVNHSPHLVLRLKKE